MNRFYTISVMVLFLFGCTHTKQFSSYDELNSHAKGKDFKLKLSQGVTIKGRDIQITPDSTYWIERHKDIKHVVPTLQINELVCCES